MPRGCRHARNRTDRSCAGLRPHRRLAFSGEPIAATGAGDALWKSATLRTAVRRLRASGNIVFIEFHVAHTKYLFHNPANLRIQWNPCLGLQDATGYLTPALLLGHELGHAQFTAHERCAMLACERPQGFQHEVYGVEEERVIASIEQPAVLELNAARAGAGLAALETAARVQHQLGRMVEVAGPLSAKPVAYD